MRKFLIKMYAKGEDPELPQSTASAMYADHQLSGMTPGSGCEMGHPICHVELSRQLAGGAAFFLVP